MFLGMNCLLKKNVYNNKAIKIISLENNMLGIRHLHRKLWKKRHIFVKNMKRTSLDNLR